VNLAGEVIGVNNWAARQGSMGIAVPSNLVRLLLPELIADGDPGSRAGRVAKP
jgi:S1-C subfamily serine protease